MESAGARRQGYPEHAPSTDIGRLLEGRPVGAGEVPPGLPPELPLLPIPVIRYADREAGAGHHEGGSHRDARGAEVR